ncbi:hypothetical protein K435DRAFT_46286 [Dendrothele bispora CBS 962.96]|uniref:Uncharacterized protein n=1 Tax=Dendrothele bispora (strain CBS 962.96) TaxID=1314807 RepID=A0A4S8KSG4_DENBC|nr:hypothetical protein K435DRAFT_46286 [Dendrothele bispora CBS 962.96]
MSSTPSNSTTTPVHSHPLAPDVETPHSNRSNRSRRGRSSHDVASSNPGSTSSNYFTLKAQLEKDSAAAGSATWDGSVKRLSKTHGHGSGEKRKSLDVVFDRTLSKPSKSPRQPPLIIVGGPDSTDLSLDVTSSVDDIANTHANATTTTTNSTTGLASTISQSLNLSTTLTSRVLATKWHEYSDEAIQAAISTLSTSSESPADVPNHPYHEALRVLSSALSSLSKARVELEAVKSALEEKERARRKRAEEVSNELRGRHEHEVVRSVVERIFVAEADDIHDATKEKEEIDDDDGSELEGKHHVRRQKSFMSLADSLSEAIADDSISRSLPRSITTRPELLGPLKELKEVDTSPPGDQTFKSPIDPSTDGISEVDDNADADAFSVASGISRVSKDSKSKSSSSSRSRKASTASKSPLTDPSTSHPKDLSASSASPSQVVSPVSLSSLRFLDFVGHPLPVRQPRLLRPSPHLFQFLHRLPHLLPLPIQHLYLRPLPTQHRRRRLTSRIQHCPRTKTSRKNPIGWEPFSVDLVLNCPARIG